MTRQTAVARCEVFTAASIIAAHSNASEKGFRQRDVCFLMDLFTNWTETNSVQSSLSIQQTQISRYLDALAVEGYAKRSRTRPPWYRLTRIGLLELMTRLISPTSPQPREHFFFLYYFVRAYRERLIALVLKEGAQFPPSLRIELEALLDSTHLLDTELRRSRQELARLDQRVSDGVNTRELTHELRRRGVGMQQVVEAIEERYPYELNNQKPLSELVGSIPPEQRMWELDEGIARRLEYLWRPSRDLLVTYIKGLEKLRTEAEPVSGR